MVNLPTPDNVTALPCKMQNSYPLIESTVFPSKHQWLWKEPVIFSIVWHGRNWNVKQATLQQVFKVITFHIDILFHHVPYIYKSKQENSIKIHWFLTKLDKNNLGPFLQLTE